MQCIEVRHAHVESQTASWLAAVVCSSSGMVVKVMMICSFITLSNSLLANTPGEVPKTDLFNGGGVGHGRVCVKFQEMAANGKTLRLCGQFRRQVFT